MSSGPPSREAMEKTLVKSPYSSSNQSALEAYLDGQAAGERPYYMEANKALLKIYQFSPQVSNPSKTALILLLAMLEFPSTDLLALSYLVPERVQKSEPCTSILKSADLLEACQFSDFWESFEAVEGYDELKPLVTAFTQKLQGSILEALALSYKNLSITKVLPAINVGSADDLLKLNHSCVESINGDLVEFVATSNNTKKNRVYQEGISFSAIASMMAKVSTE